MVDDRVRCPCGAVVHVPVAGRYVACPKCGRMVTRAAAGRKSGEGGGPSPPEPPGQRRQQAPSGIEPAEEHACPVCGAPMEAGMQECLACGYRPAAPGTSAEEAPAEAGLKKVVLVIFAVVCIAGVVIGLVFIPGGAEEEPPVEGAGTAEDRGYLGTAVHTLQDTKVKSALWSVRQSMEAFRAMEGRYPRSLDELAQAGMPAPPPPSGYRYVYDPTAGAVDLEKTTPPQGRQDAQQEP